MYGYESLFYADSINQIQNFTLFCSPLPSWFYVFDNTIYIFLQCVSLISHCSNSCYYFYPFIFILELTNAIILQYYSILHLISYLPFPVCFIFSYVVMLLISILLFQLKGPPLAFLIRQE